MNDATQFFGGVAGGYEIERSLRFNSSDSAYLSRTPSVAGNRKTWTWAGWVKRSALGSFQDLFGAFGSVTDYFVLRFTSSDTLEAFDRPAAGGTGQITTTQVFRDTSAWYHIVYCWDSSNATPSDRRRLYVNGTRVTTFSTDQALALNTDSRVNSVISHRLGNVNTNYFSGYLADIHFIDGQALTPTSFGETDTNGVWQPKAYSGSYGTNGFHLPFSDNSTAAALGTDTSGNSNTWTVNNISVAAGAGNDSLVDSPTNYGTDTGAGGEVRGNYATWNPLANGAAQLTYSNGNLDLAQSNTASYALPANTIGVSSGKWYWETTITSSGSCRTGVLKDGSSLSTFLGNSSTAYGYASGGYKANSNSNSASGYSSYTSGDVIGVALDLDNGKLYFSKNGTWQESGNPATQTNPAYTGLSGTYFASWGKDDYVNTSCSVNFGQRPFAYTAPSGFKALCTANLPEPTIADGSTAMDVALYTVMAQRRPLVG